MPDPLARLWRDIQAAPVTEPDPEAIAAATANEVATQRADESDARLAAHIAWINDRCNAACSALSVLRTNKDDDASDGLDFRIHEIEDCINNYRKDRIAYARRNY